MAASKIKEDLDFYVDNPDYYSTSMYPRSTDIHDFVQENLDEIEN